MHVLFICLCVTIDTNHSSGVLIICSVGLNVLDDGDKPVIVAAFVRLLRFVGTTDVDKLTLASDKYALNMLSMFMLSLQEHSMTCLVNLSSIQSFKRTTMLLTTTKSSCFVYV